MLRFLSRWRPRHLLGAWVGYWLVLAAAGLRDAIAAAWHVTHLPEDKANISLSFGDGLLRLLMSADGSPMWEGSISTTALAAWTVGPPLLLWLAWMWSKGRPASAPAASSALSDKHTGRPAMLGAPGLGPSDLTQRDREAVPARGAPKVRDSGTGDRPT